MSNLAILTMRGKQTGSTLLVSLVVMIILMLLGITSMVSSNSQYKLTGNLQFENVAMGSAEAATTAAEVWLTNSTNFRDAAFTTYNGTKPAYLPIGHLATLAAPDNNLLTMDWVGKSVAVTANERYIIERMSTNNSLLGSSKGTGGRNSAGCNKVDTYRVTARGVGSRGATKFVQSYYSVTINHNDPDVKC